MQPPVPPPVRGVGVQEVICCVDSATSSPLEIAVYDSICSVAANAFVEGHECMNNCSLRFDAPSRSHRRPGP